MADSDVTERIRILLDLEKEAHDRAAKQAAREVLNLEKSYDPLSRAVARQEVAMRKLSAQFDAGKIDAAQMARLQDGIQREYDQTVDKINRVNAAMAANTNTQGGMMAVVNRNKNAFQQLGYQVGDFAVQVGGGTSAFTAFAQQGSQVLGILGPFGAIAGAAVAIAAPLAGAYFAMGGEAETAADKQKSLNEATDAYAAAAEAARQPISDLRAVYGDLADEVQRALGVTQELAGVTAARALQSAADGIAGGFGTVTGSAPGIDDDGQAAYAYAKTLRSLRKDFDLTTKDASTLMGRLSALSRAEGPEEIIAAAEALQALMISLAGSVEEAGDRFGDTFAAVGNLIEQAADQASAGITETERLLRQYADAESEVMRLGRERIALEAELQAATEDADRARISRAEKALEVLDAEILKTYDLKDALDDAAASAKGMFDWLSSVTGLDISGALGGMFDGAGGVFSDWINRAEGMDSAKSLIRAREGFRSEPYWDVNHYRAGYGSDTTTDAQGNVSAVTQGVSVSFEDAERDLQRRITDYFNTMIDQLGFDRFNEMTGAQQGAMASLLHNYGAGEFQQGGDLGGVLDALQNGNDQLVSQRIAELGAHNGGVNMSRRREEAQAFGDPSTTFANQTAASNAQASATREAEQAERERTQAAEASQKAIDSLRASQDAAVAAEQEYAEAIGVVDEALRLNQITESEAMAARAEAMQDYQEALAKIESPDTKVESSRLKTLESGYASLTQTLLSAAQAGQSVGDALRSWLADAALKALAQDLVSTIMQLGGGTGIFGSVMGWLTGTSVKSFDGGGYTGSGARSGGMDGKGGYLAMVHPNETVVDHTKGQGVASAPKVAASAAASPQVNVQTVNNASGLVSVATEVTPSGVVQRVEASEQLVKMMNSGKASNSPRLNRKPVARR
ncbi:hypothetical protein Q4543_17585 [Salipiger sp. 1_MG-2023]|uniref:glycoside hydrolase family protein n=1 Tax=Salipiger sp. 1_MG-2023 TaxID=3062665 RepID=UPI0026E387FB|nr:hypothetical protein [Salipiger sp. 1_MG-2023]MDO6587327.1 hypothetical protein [Salipiger sp. 1_MG-2023]